MATNSQYTGKSKFKIPKKPLGVTKVSHKGTGPKANTGGGSLKKDSSSNFGTAIKQGKQYKKKGLTDDQKKMLRQFGDLATKSSKIAGEVANRYKEAGTGGGEEIALASEGGGKGYDFSEEYQDPVISDQQRSYNKTKKQYGLA